ncbi:MAG: hypothetical protein KC553_02795 [Nitrospina sp.]|nr:hypothetical protein [Nitrospina sp.]
MTGNEGKNWKKPGKTQVGRFKTIETAGIISNLRHNKERKNGLPGNVVSGGRGRGVFPGKLKSSEKSFIQKLNYN